MTFDTKYNFVMISKCMFTQQHVNFTIWILNLLMGNFKCHIENRCKVSAAECNFHILF